MDLILAKLFVLQLIAALIAALPSKISLRSQFPPSHLEVIQLPEGGFGNQTNYITEDVCVAVFHPKIPTKVVLGNKQLESMYEITGYSTDCSGRENSSPPTAFNFNDYINRRHPICSFNINHLPMPYESSVTVAFVGESSSQVLDTFTLSNTSCVNIDCSSPYSRTVYASSLNISKNGKMSKNSINIFKENGCTGESILAPNIRNGADLAKLTRESVEIKSFYVRNKFI